MGHLRTTAARIACFALLTGFGLDGCMPRPAAKPAQAAEFMFRNVASEAGLDFTHSNGGQRPLDILHTTGSGLAWIDYDQDGYPDLFCVNDSSSPGTPPGDGHRLFRNRHDGTFEDVTARAGLLGRGQQGMGVAVGDFDGDAAPDLYITCFRGDHLYRNRGDGTFADVTRSVIQSPVDASRWSTGAAWFDADADGDLDLYVAGYCALGPATPRFCTLAGQQTACPPSHYEGQPDLFLRNDRGITLSPDAAMFPLSLRPPGRGLGVLPVDLDGDRQPELLVANDGGGNFLFRKQDKQYRDVAYRCGVALSNSGADPAGMGVDAADVNGDGLPDLLMANFQDEPNLLYRQDTPLIFHDVSTEVGLDLPTRKVLTFGAGLVDFNLDGEYEALFINGHVQDNIQKIVTGATWAQRPQLFTWHGGMFHEVSPLAGPVFQAEIVGRGCAFADFDRDGDEDVAVSVSGGRVQLWRNDSRRGHWLQVELQGRKPNTAAIGARITVRAGGKTLSRSIITGRSYLSDSERILTFGLGNAAGADGIEVQWPDGRLQRVPASAANRRIVIREGEHDG